MTDSFSPDETNRVVPYSVDPEVDERPSFVAPTMLPPGEPAPVQMVLPPSLPRPSGTPRRAIGWMIVAAVVVLALVVAALVYFKPWAGVTPTTASPAKADISKWTAVLGGNDGDEFNDVALTNDGVVAVGATSSTNGDFPVPHRANGADAVIVKMSADGKLVWAKTLGGTGDDEFDSVIVAPDGRIYAAGVFASTDGDHPLPAGQEQSVVFCFTSKGDVVWSRTYADKDMSYIGDMALAADGGLIVLGYPAVDMDSYQGTASEQMAELSPDGDVVWANSYGDAGTYWRKLAVSSDGTIFTSGSKPYDPFDDPLDVPPAYVLALAPDGTQLWLNTYSDGLNTIYNLTVWDGHIYVSGSYLQPDPDTGELSGNHLFAALDAADGSVTWVTPLDGMLSFGALCTTPSGDLVAMGAYMNPYAVQPGLWVSGAVIYDMASDGTLVWRRAYGDAGDYGFNAAVISPNGNIVVAGGTNSPIGPFPLKYPGGSDALIAVLSPDGS